jgi:hypothetical protein
MRRRKKPRTRPAPEKVKLKAPAGCGPFKRDGRRYVPSSAGIVEVPIGLIDDLSAHGFAPLVEAPASPAPARLAALDKRRRKHGDR